MIPQINLKTQSITCTKCSNLHIIRGVLKPHVYFNSTEPHIYKPQGTLEPTDIMEDRFIRGL